MATMNLGLNSVRLCVSRLYDIDISGLPLEIQIEGCKASNLSKSVGNLREILKIEGCN